MWNDFLWNGVLTGVLAALVATLSLVPAVRRRPALRHALWLLVLLKPITPPFVPIPVIPMAFADPRATSFSEAPVRDVPTRPLSMSATALSSVSSGATADSPIRGPDFSRLALLVSLVGTSILLMATWRQIVLWQRVLQCGRADDSRIQPLVDRCCRQMSLVATPAVCVVAADCSPCLWVRRSGPVIVIPRELANRMSDEQLSCVIAHELAHYARGDHWTNLLSLAIAAACWWNPVVWWARRELRGTQELCCDALVIGRHHASRRMYATALFQALEFTQAERVLVPALASAFGGRTSIRRRFEMIADVRLNDRLSWWCYPLLLVGFALLPCLPVAAEGPGLKLADCPKGVQKSVRNEVGSGRVLDIEKITKDGKTVFEVDVQIEKDVYELQLSAQGKLLAKVLEDEDEADDKEDDEDEDEDDDEDEAKVSLKLDDLPKAVRKTLKQVARGGDIEELEREIEDGRIIYSAEVEFETESGEVVYDIEIAENGLLLSKVLENDEEDEDDEEDRD